MKQYVIRNGSVVVLKEGVNYEEYKEKVLAAGGTVEKIRKPPTLKTMQRWIDDGVAKATDGCTVEPDGSCPHGKKSWVLVLGLI